MRAALPRHLAVPVRRGRGPAVLLAAVAAVAAVLAGGPATGTGGAVAAGAPLERVTAEGPGGQGRSYLLARPATSGAGLPLLVVVHGRTDGARAFATRTGFGQYAASGRAVVAFPDATAPQPGRSSWNAGTCCRPAVTDGVPDLDYVSAVVTDAVTRTGADPSRVWWVGFSNGAMLGYRVVCERPGLVSAVVAVGGSRQVDRCTPGRAVPFLHVHGASDGTVPLAGRAWSPTLQTALRSARDSVAAPAAAAGCDGWRTVSRGLRTRTVGTGCTTPVELDVLRGRTHRWVPADTTYAWRWLSSLAASTAQ